MAKPKSRYVCQACGSVSSRWQGQCADCAEWNTLVQESAEVSSIFAAKHNLQGGGRVIPLVGLETPAALPERLPSGLAEFDRAIGGGIVPGSAMLVGGDPGIGKSTLLLQVAARLASAGNRVVYVSGEESAEQVRLRAVRLGLGAAPVRLAAATSVRDILTTVGDGEPPALLIIDSIQTMHSDLIEGAPGTVSQVRASAQELVRFAKERGSAMVLVGHVTKDGSIAGPRVLEHVVDVVLHFEGDRNSRFRMVRALKNRFGPVDEVGCFDLAAEGITAVTDPTGLFVENHRSRVPGTCVAVAMEGRRPMLAEIQALVATTPLERPRRTTSGLDSARVAMILASLQQHCRIALHTQDVFVSTVGGARLAEPASDLAIAIALASAAIGSSPPHGVVALGEISLAGEVRKVRDLPQRIAEAARLGFRVAVVPVGDRSATHQQRTVDGMTVVEVADLPGALTAVGLTAPRRTPARGSD